MLVKKTLEYLDQEAILEGYYVVDKTQTIKRPLVLVAHDWSGRNEFACQKAEKLAVLGYVGFALDMYGKGKQGQTIEEKSKLMKPLMEGDRTMLHRRILAGLHVASQLDCVDSTKVAAIGFCFGGLCVLDLARLGAPVKGVVSFHGLLNAFFSSKITPIQAKILVLHGYADPMVTPDALRMFEKEMTVQKVDWQAHVYGHAMHAFTNPEAHDASFGTVYDPIADQRSWIAMQNFLEEVFT